MFATVKRAISSYEEKKFYDVALHFLAAEGYKELSIVDGSGDGGRDVICSRSDIRIQLSIRKDWEDKINGEAAATAKQGKYHFIYVTNRNLREAEKEDFLTNRYKLKGDVTITIFDLNRIATSLSKPGVIQTTYALLGLVVDRKVSATPREIALSNLLLFSAEARELKASVIESNLKAYLLKNSDQSEATLVAEVAASLPGEDLEKNVRSVLHRLQANGEVHSVNGGKISLSDDCRQTMTAAENEFSQAAQSEFTKLCDDYKLSSDDAKKIINLSLEILARDKALTGDGVLEEDLAALIARVGLTKRRAELYEDLSRLTVARVKQYGKTLDHIFSANTFDIYRALGRNADITLLLDASVAMPLIFGLSFGEARSRYGIASAVLNDLCMEHKIKVMLPRSYLNEMASHGIKALEFMEAYDAFAEDAKEVLKNASNAYISHFSHLRFSYPEKTLELSQFLAFFGIKKGAKLSLIENTIESILGDFGIEIKGTGQRDQAVYDEIYARKPYDPPVIVEHDAEVCSLLKNDHASGYIFATWDRVMVEVVEGLSRILADTPARIIDFLSMATGANVETEQSFELLTSLIHCDEVKAAAVARKIEKINSAQAAYEFKAITDAARLSNQDWSIDVTTVDTFLKDKKILRSGEVGENEYRTID